MSARRRKVEEKERKKKVDQNQLSLSSLPGFSFVFSSKREHSLTHLINSPNSSNLLERLATDVLGVTQLLEDVLVNSYLGEDLSLLESRVWSGRSSCSKSVVSERGVSVRSSMLLE